MRGKVFIISDPKLTTDKSTEGIAIIGMSGRFPGARNIDEFWQNLRNGVDSVTNFSDQELEASGIDPANLRNPSYIKAGAILGDVGLFDADFFEITGREAAGLDPQHRLLLECAWETLEHAGYSPSSYTGAIGVYAGSRVSEYLFYNLPIPDMAGLNVKSGSLLTNWKRVMDNDKDTLATRIAYKLDLRGEAITMQTACSTSLVTVHMASQSLLRDECDIILAGGVCVRVPQKAGYLYTEGMIFSPDGHTRAFDAKGEGTIFSSGVGMVALKRLDKALADGDCIQAVIRGSAVNNDGDAMKAAFTAPSLDGQVEVITKALAAAQVDPESISYVEAHGTATTHGDLTEMSSLTKAFRSGTDMKGFCALGSVKTNIGHPTQAAGIIGLIKTVLMLKHKMLVPHLHFEEPNPHIDFVNSPFYVNTKLTEWKAGNSPRRAGVNSFGVGGTNVHVVLEEAPVTEHSMVATDRPTHILCLSAKNEGALKDLVGSYEEFFNTNPGTPVEDVCFTANVGRSHFTHRLTVIADSSTAMQEQLSALSSGDDPESIPDMHIVDSDQPMTAFLFSGQGSQYINMGRQLFDTQPRFRETMKKCDKLLRPYLKQSLLSVLYPDTRPEASSQGPGKVGKISGNLDETIYTQTSLFALEYSLYELWKSWGVVPDVVMGHSIGEYVAACVAGVFDIEEGLRLVAERGRLMQGLAGNGAMAAVFADEELVKKFMKGYSDKVSIAALNGPRNVVVSGDQEAVQAFLQELEREGIKGHRLTVSHAFHSPLVEPIMEPFEQIAASVNYSAPKIKIISNVTGQLVEGLDVSCASYWRRHLREPVMFANSMGTLSELGCTTFVELGPGSTLLGMGRQCVKKDNGDWLASLKKGREDWPQILKGLGALYVGGLVVDWSGFDQDYPRQRVALPTYPFQRKRYWIERKRNERQPEDKEQSRFVHSSASNHPLLGQRLSSALKEIQFESRLNVGSAALLQYHCVFDIPVLSATCYIEMVTAAVSQIATGTGPWLLQDVEIRQALILPQDDHTTVQLILTPEDAYGYSFQVLSLPADNGNDNTSWKSHVTGRIRCGPQSLPLPDITLESARGRCSKELQVDSFYELYLKLGMGHGPAFQSIRKLWQGDGEALAQVQLPDDLTEDAGRYRLHPVLLDGCLQAGRAAFLDQDGQTGDIYLPTLLERVHVCCQLKGRLWCHAVASPDDAAESATRTMAYHIFDSEGNIVAEIERLHHKRVTSELLQKLIKKPDENWLYEIKWQPKPLEVSEPVAQDQQGTWLIFADQNGVSSQLARHLRENGETCITVFPGKFSNNIEKDTCHINPILPEDFQKLLSHVCALPGPLRGVVHLWGLENLSSEDAVSNSLMDTQVLDCASGLHLIQALVKENETELPSLWFVTRGAQPVTSKDPSLSVEHSPLWGLGRVAAREHPKLRCTMVDLDPADRQDEDSMLFKELWSGDIENQVGFRQQARYVSRLISATGTADNEIRIEAPDAPCFRLEPSSGILNNMSLQAIERPTPGPGEVEICVRATGLNFRDVLSALGKYPGNPGPLGRECSGTIAAVGEGVEGLEIGDDVLAICSGGFGNYVIANAHFVVSKPGFLSFEDAASIPITFLTAYHGLYNLCKLKAGEEVLIHAAAGGVGLAAAQLVKWAGGEIFATASPGKWEFLKSTGIRHIMNSRSLDFADDVMTLTDGQGVDIVLNSLAGDFIPKSFSVLGNQGRFIEIGKSGIWDAKQVSELRPDVSYFPFDLGDAGHKDPEFYQAMFQKLMDGFREGKLKPLPQKRFPIEDSIKAFRYMAQAKHIGKIVVYQQDPLETQGQKETGILRSDASYLITGGLGALGLQVAGWLQTQNARHIVLLGRKGPSNDAREVISKLEKNGVQVHVAQGDVSNKEQLDKVLKEMTKSMPPLKGIIHAAGILDDGVLMHQTWERFVKVMTPKVAGAWNLHVLTQEMPLDFFVLFSSVSSLWGTPGQGNYSAANAFLDGLAHFRRTKKLPCVSVNWGSWAEVGMAAALDSNIQQRKKTRGLGTIDLESGLKILGRLISGDSVQTAVFNVNWVEYIQQFSAGVAPPFFSEMLKEKRQYVKVDKVQHAKQAGLLLQINKAPVGQRQQILFDYVREETTKMLGLDPGEPLAPQRLLVELGLDSLSAIELRNAFELSIGCALPAVLLYDYPTLEDVSNYLAKKIIPKEAISDTHSELLQSGNGDNKISRESDGVSSENIEPSFEEKQPEALQSKELQSMVPIQTSGSKLPFFIVHNTPLSIHLGLGPDQPIYFFRSLWDKGKLSSEIRIEDIAADHIKEMKTVQPEGPYFLEGYSIGGLIAFEMAQQLYRQGEEIALLFLLEPISPVRFSSEEVAKVISSNSKKKAWYSLMNMFRKFLGTIIRKIIEIGFSGFNAILNSRIPLPSSLRVDYVSILYRLSRNKHFAHSYPGRIIIDKVKQAIVDSGLSLPSAFREGYVDTLYLIAWKNYFAHTYPGRIIIYKVKQKSTVNIFTWEQLAKGGAEIKDMDLRNHLDPHKIENKSAWINGLKDYLEKAQASCSAKTMSSNVHGFDIEDELEGSK
ncbi:MAG: SDR family NAD(P)-dependent oxidoreductase [Candidatus Brocadiaceae bacterium]|nr:SDR family NAD(P)-dependent oxidoreductase [Candidatus Brocadiaceae bacterium]